MKNSTTGRLIVVFIIALVPFILLWLLYYDGLKVMDCIIWSVASLLMIGLNIWDQQKLNRKHALDEVDNARELTERSQFRAAMECLRKADQYDPKCFEVKIARGDVYRNEQSYDKARRELFEAISLQPNSFRAHFALGVTYLQEKMVYEAISEFRRTIDLKPDYNETYFILAQAYELAGEKSEAVKSYQNYLKRLSPEDTANKKVMDNVDRCNARIRALK